MGDFPSAVRLTTVIFAGIHLGSAIIGHSRTSHQLQPIYRIGNKPSYCLLECQRVERERHPVLTTNRAAFSAICERHDRLYALRAAFSAICERHDRLYALLPSASLQSNSSSVLGELSFLRERL